LNKGLEAIRKIRKPVEVIGKGINKEPLYYHRALIDGSCIILRETGYSQLIP